MHAHRQYDEEFREERALSLANFSIDEINANPERVSQNWFTETHEIKAFQQNHREKR